MQNHVIKCLNAKNLQREFIRERAKELININNSEVEEEDILDMLEEIASYFNSRDLSEHEKTSNT